MKLMSTDSLKDTKEETRVKLNMVGGLEILDQFWAKCDVPSAASEDLVPNCFASTFLAMGMLIHR